MPQSVLVAFAVSAATTALSFAFQMLFPTVQEGPTTEEFKSSGSRFGVPIPLVYGSVRIGSNLIAAGPVTERSTTTRVAKSTKSTTYTYFQTLAFGLCEGPIGQNDPNAVFEVVNQAGETVYYNPSTFRAILRVWADKKLIYDATSTTKGTQGGQESGTTIAGSSSPDDDTNHVVLWTPDDSITAPTVSSSLTDWQSQQQPFTVYPGDEDQLPDPALESILGVGNVPAFRGLAYVVWSGFPLSEFGNRIPTMEFELTKDVKPVYYANVFDPVGNFTEPGIGDFANTSTLDPYNKYYRDLTFLFIDEFRPYAYGIVRGRATVDYDVAVSGYTDSTLAYLGLGFVKFNKFTGETIRATPAYYTVDKSVYSVGSETEGPIGLNALNYFNSSVDQIITAPQTGRVFTFKFLDVNVNYSSTLQYAWEKLAWFIELSPDSLEPIAVSPSIFDTGAIFTTTGTDLHTLEPIQLCCNGDGKYVLVMLYSTGVVYGLWNTESNIAVFEDFYALGYPSTDEAGYSPMESVAYGGPTLTAACFDNENNVWIGTTDGYLHKLTITEDGHLIKVAEFTPINPIPTYTSTIGATNEQITAITYVPSTNELIIWYDKEPLASITPGSTYDIVTSFIRFSLDTQSSSSSAFPYRSTSVLPGSVKSQMTHSHWSDKAGKWANSPMFVTVTQDGASVSDYIIFFNLINAETGDIIVYSLELWGDHTPRKLGYLSIGYVPEIDAFFSIRFSSGSYENIAEEARLNYGYGIGIYYLTKAAAGQVTLKDIAEDLTIRGGGSPSEYNYTTFTDIVKGFVVNRRMSVRSALQALQPAYLFNIVETDWVLKGIKGGTAPVMTIDSDYMGAKTDPESKQDKLIAKRINEKEIPEWIDFNYLDRDRDYLSGSEPARRTDGTQSSDNVASVDVPVVMTASEASTAAYRLLYYMWSKEWEYRFSTWFNALALDPGDGILIERNSRLLEARVKKISYGANGILEIEAESYDTGVFSLAPAVSSSVTGFYRSTIEVYAPPEVFILDTALLRLTDDTPGLYVAAGPALDNSGFTWDGATILKGVTSTTLEPILTAPSDLTFGYLTESLPAYDSFTTWDRTNTLKVKLRAGTLTTVSEAVLLGNIATNTVIVGNEIIRFATATEIGDGVWHLTNLLRGRRGTEKHITTHTPGTRFVLLDGALRTHDYEQAEINLTYYYQGISGGSVGEGPIFSVNQVTRRLLPYAPYFIEATRPGTPDGVDITWLRRSRASGPLLHDSPLQETSENYEVDILAASGDTVVRTITTSASSGGSVVDAALRSCYYSAADATADFGGVPDVGNLHVKVYQISSVVGRGYAGEAFI